MKLFILPAGITPDKMLELVRGDELGELAGAVFVGSVEEIKKVVLDTADSAVHEVRVGDLCQPLHIEGYFALDDDLRKVWVDWLEHAPRYDDRLIELLRADVELKKLWEGKPAKINQEPERFKGYQSGRKRYK